MNIVQMEAQTSKVKPIEKKAKQNIKDISKLFFVIYFLATCR
jgi:hypothetical protein